MYTGKFHGLSRHPIKTVWRNMKRRCLDETCEGYKDYGGRGITICDRWINDLGLFAADMGFPKPGQTIERKDNDGPYSPENCIWADRTVQGNNTRSNVVVWLEGEERTRFTVTELCRFMGVDRNLVYTRLRNGWTIGEAIAIPKGVTAGIYERDEDHCKSMSSIKRGIR